MVVDDEVVDDAAAGGAAHDADAGAAAGAAPSSAAYRSHPAASVAASSSLKSPQACHLQRINHNAFATLQSFGQMLFKIKCNFDQHQQPIERTAAHQAKQMELIPLL